MKGVGAHQHPEYVRVHRVLKHENIAIVSAVDLKLKISADVCACLSINVTVVFTVLGQGARGVAPHPTTSLPHLSLAAQRRLHQNLAARSNHVLRIVPRTSTEEGGDATTQPRYLRHTKITKFEEDQKKKQ